MPAQNPYEEVTESGWGLVALLFYSRMAVKSYFGIALPSALGSGRLTHDNSAEV